MKRRINKKMWTILSLSIFCTLTFILLNCQPIRGFFTSGGKGFTGIPPPPPTLADLVKEQRIFRYRFFHPTKRGLKVIPYAVKDFIRDWSNSAANALLDSNGKRILQNFTHAQVRDWFDAPKGNRNGWDGIDYDLLGITAELLVRSKETRGDVPPNASPTTWETCYKFGDFRTYFTDPPHYQDPNEVKNRILRFRQHGFEFLQLNVSGPTGCQYQKYACENIYGTKRFCVSPSLRTLNYNRTEKLGVGKTCNSHLSVLPHYVDIPALLLKATQNGTQAPFDAKPILIVPQSHISSEPMCPRNRPFCSYISRGDIAEWKIPYTFSTAVDAYGCLPFDLNQQQFISSNAHVKLIEERRTIKWEAKCNRTYQQILFEPKANPIERLIDLWELVTPGERHEASAFCIYDNYLYCGEPRFVGDIHRCRCIQDLIFYKDDEFPGIEGCTKALPFLAACGGDRNTPTIPDPTLKTDWKQFGVTADLFIHNTVLFGLKKVVKPQCMHRMYCKQSSGHHRCLCSYNNAGFNCNYEKAILIEHNSERYIPLDNSSNELSESNQVARLRPYVFLNKGLLELQSRMTIPPHSVCKEDPEIDNAMLRIRTFYSDLKSAGMQKVTRYDEFEKDYNLLYESVHKQKPLCAISFQSDGSLHHDPILVCIHKICRRVDGYEDIDELMLAFEAEMRLLFRKGSRDQHGQERPSGPCDYPSLLPNITSRRQDELDNYVNSYLNIDRSIHGKRSRIQFTKQFEQTFINVVRVEGRIFCRTELGLSCINDTADEVPYCGCRADEYVPWDFKNSSNPERNAGSCAIQYSHPCDLCIPNDKSPTLYNFHLRYPCSRLKTDNTVFSGRGFRVAKYYCIDGAVCDNEVFGAKMSSIGNPVPDAKYCHKKVKRSKVEKLIPHGTGTIRTPRPVCLLIVSLTLIFSTANANE